MKKDLLLIIISNESLGISNALVQNFKTFMKGNIDLYLDRISSLAHRNKTLIQQQEKIAQRYYFIQKQDDTYLNLVADHKLEQDDDKRIRRLSKLKRFTKVSLLYVSIRGFEKLLNNDRAGELIDKLDELHFQFDQIAKKYLFVKIKTVGDSFIYGAGMLEENRTNPIDVILAAFEMQKAAININGGPNKSAFWNVSIGIHTGPVLAESTGRKSAPYRLSGHSVDFTCRLGMTCNPGEINISALTYELVKEFFICKPFGKMPVKYKGNIEMYKVYGLLSELKGVKGDELFNNTFLTKYSLIQFLDIQEYVLDMLEQELPDKLYYHNVKHTIDVVTEVELIGWSEGLTEEEILILKMAGLFHDVGHIVSYHNHEYHGTVIATQFLQKYHYPQDMIDKICQLILATQYPPKPKNIMEKVICDSDLDYLGRDDFIPVSEMLYEELKEREMVGTYEEWNEKQLQFIKAHQYHTKTAQTLRQVKKNKQIARLERLINEEAN